MNIGVEDLIKLMAAAGVLLGAMTTFYLTAVKPALAQIKELIIALRENTTATNTSADNLVTTAAAVSENTVVTKAVAEALPNGPVTVNVSQPPTPPANP